MSRNAFNYYYVFEIIGEGERLELQIRNKDVIDKIRNCDDETMREVKSLITNWKTKHGLD